MASRLQIVGCTATQLTGVIAAATLQGLATGLVLLVFAAVPELCPYKYRLVVGWAYV